MSEWRKYKLEEIAQLEKDSLKAEFEEQLKEESVLNKRIAENLAKIELKDE